MGNKYRLGRKIGSGSFGDIYLGECESLSQGWLSQLHHCFGVIFLACWYLWGPRKVGRSEEEKKTNGIQLVAAGLLMTKKGG